MTKSFISKNIERKVFLQQGCYLLNTYVHTYISVKTPVSRMCDNSVL